MNENKEILYEVGDASSMTYLRSSAKPFQAIPSFLHHVEEYFSLHGREASLFMASQRGESYHQKALESLLKKIDIPEDTFICHPSYPLNEKAKENYISKGGQPRKLFHNCAGKHLAFLALSKKLGLPLEAYHQLNAGVQQLALDAMAVMSGLNKTDIKLGVDGCGFPVYAMPLSHIAQAYLHLACPDLLSDPTYRNAAHKIGQLMNKHPEMIASHEFVCTTLLEDPNIVAKGGAKGVYGIGLREERIGISLKVMDGSEAVWPNIIAHILEEIDYKNKETIKRLYQLSPKALTNDGDQVVGERKTVFSLQ